MKPTLGQVLVLSLLGVLATLALLFTIVFRASHATIVESSERARDHAAREVGDRVARSLSEAPSRVQQFQAQITFRLLDGRNMAEVERALYALLLSEPNLGELSLTYGVPTGYDADDDIQLAAEGRGAMTVAREPDSKSGKLSTTHVYQENGVFVADHRELGADASVAVRVKTGGVPDPTEHLTFKTPANRQLQGELHASDLHWSQLDAALPEAQRRVEVSVQQSISDADGRFLGVLRVGLLTRQLDRATQLRLTSEGEPDPHRIFLCDDHGRLITRLAPTDLVEESGDELRVAPSSLPPEVTAAVATSMPQRISETSPAISGQFSQGGTDFLATFRALPETQGWLVGIVAPRAFYFGKLTAIRDRMLAFSLAIVVLVSATGAIILRAVRRAQARIVKESLRMNRFEFAPGSAASAFRDVSEILEGLEKAKTAMRAMGKYVPVDLVRRLYREKTEPELGGKPMEVSLMFTDIKGFTALSERLDPDQLAAALGRYLETMAHVIQQETSGTIDKYIGDAIMTMWNAPEPVPDHARRACLAALRCREAEHELARRPEWAGLPSFSTRFGLHCDTALVGHFGAPDRMNYTVIGDAVNLASRLEGLNKAYGTTIIASESIAVAARESFDFRLLDLVAVKGKTHAVRIYELLGTRGATPALDQCVADYERALAAYLAGAFAAALTILEPHQKDPPSAVLRERCLQYQLDPPPPGWNGVHIAKEK